MSREVNRPDTAGLVRALVLSLMAAAIPIAGVFLFPDTLQDYEALTWLLLLVPAFVWAYERGWQGIATALAFGMVVLSTTYATAAYRGSAVPDLMFAVVVVIVVTTLGIGLFRQRVAEAEADQATEQLALRDPLTDLPNRRHAELHIEMEMVAAQRGRNIAVVMFDVDRMKEYNGRNGRAAGDGVLRGFGTLLRQHTRRMDLAARGSADSFISVLGNCAEEGAVVFAGRVQERLRAAESTVTLPTVSAGIACYQPDMKSAHDLLAAAEAALQQAQRDGGNRVRIHGRQPSELRAADSTVLQRLAAEGAAQSASELPGRVRIERAHAAAPARMGAGRSAFVLTTNAAARTRLVLFLRTEQFHVAEATDAGEHVLAPQEDYDLIFIDVGPEAAAVAAMIREVRVRSPVTRVVGIPHTDGGAVAPDLLRVRVDAHYVPTADPGILRQQLAELLAERDALVAAQLRQRQLSNELRAKDHEARVALAASEAKYRSVVQTIQEVIFTTDAEGAWTFLNPAWTAITGFNAEESLGHPIFEFLHPDEGDVVRGEFSRLAAARTSYYRHEGRWRTRAGTYRWIELRLQLVLTPGGTLAGTSGVLADVTDRRHAEDALRQSEAYFRSLIENSADMMAVLNTDGTVRYVSPAVERILGGRTEDWLGIDPLTRVHLDDLPRATSTLAGVIAEVGVTASTEVRVQHADGSWRLIQLTARNLTTTVGVTGIVVNARDATERQRTERALRDSEAMLLRAQKMDAIGRLAGGVAHDFNNLLTTIQGHAELLLSEVGDGSDIGADLNDIRDAATRATALTRQLLAFSRQQVMQPRVLDVNAVVHDVEKMLRRVIGEHVTLTTELAVDAGRVRADRTQLEQVLVNLIVNARDALPRGGSVNIETTRHELKPDDLSSTDVPPGDYLRLRVRDTGTGMSLAVAAHAFEPFFTTKAPGAGTGLGLSTVYGIVKQSGGHVWLESEKGAGTVVTVLLPRVEEKADVIEQPQQSATATGGSETILLVEDEKAVRELTLRMLQRAGYDVLVANNGREALDVLHRERRSIHLLLTDVVMPELNGQDLAELARAMRPGIPVLFISGYTEEAVLRHGMLAADTAFLEKPFTPSALLQRVRVILDGLSP